MSMVETILRVRTGNSARHMPCRATRLVTAGAVLDDDLFSNFFPPSSALEKDTWESMSPQMQAMEREAADMLWSSRLMQEAERTRFLQDSKPIAPGSGLSYYSEQHGSHFQSWNSVTVWSSTTDLAPPVESGPDWLAAGMALVGVYLVIGAAFWARYSVTRFSVAKRWQLVVLWPFLLAMNSTFRSEFLDALRRWPSSDAEKTKLQDKDGSST